MIYPGLELFYFGLNIFSIHVGIAFDISKVIQAEHVFGVELVAIHGGDGDCSLFGSGKFNEDIPEHNVDGLI